MKTMMKWPILACAEKLQTSLVYRTKKPLISRVRTQNGLISRGSQSGVSMVRDL